MSSRTYGVRASSSLKGKQSITAGTTPSPLLFTKYLLTDCERTSQSYSIREHRGLEKARDETRLLLAEGLEEAGVDPVARAPRSSSSRHSRSLVDSLSFVDGRLDPRVSSASRKAFVALASG